MTSSEQDATREARAAERPRYGAPPELGPNYGRATSDEFWDAAHVLAPGERAQTLCGRPVDGVAQAYSMDSGYKPGDGAGCWTCLSESNRWAREAAPIHTTETEDR